MADLRVIVISSVRPEPTSAGKIILHRHLAGQAGLKVEVFGTEPEKLTPSSALRRFFGRMQRTSLRRISGDFWAAWEGRWLDEHLPRQIARDRRTVVLTVAHGDASMAALRFAKKHRLPLVVFFHDWWPDISEVHAPFRRRLEKDFRHLYREATVALCVCGGMQANLGEHSGAAVLYPIPKKMDGGDAVFSTPKASLATPFKIYYFGNLSEYGPMLAEALKKFGKHDNLRLEVRGGKPNWPVNFREMMRAECLWKDFAPRHELDAWLADADAFLIPMIFDSALRRRMETSFPSKLIEAAQIGKPLVIWGPEYCSAVRWAQKGSRALCVTSPHADDLLASVKKLASDPKEQQRLAAAARQAAQTDFNPDRIQAQFMDALRRVVSNQLNHE